MTTQHRYFSFSLPPSLPSSSLTPLLFFSIYFSLSLCLSGAVSQCKLLLTPGPEGKKAKRGDGMLVLFYKTKRSDGKWCKEREKLITMKCDTTDHLKLSNSLTLHQGCCKRVCPPVVLGSFASIFQSFPIMHNFSIHFLFLLHQESSFWFVCFDLCLCECFCDI